MWEDATNRASSPLEIFPDDLDADVGANTSLRRTSR